MEILKKIDKLRYEKGWSINRLAQVSGITQSTLANLFTKRNSPSIPTLEKLCKGLGITLSEFFAETTEEFINVENQNLLENFNKLNLKNKNAVKTLINNLK